MAELIYFHVTLVKQNSAAKHEYAKIKQLAMPNIVISVCSLSKEGLGTNLPNLHVQKIQYLLNIIIEINIFI